MSVLVIAAVAFSVVALLAIFRGDIGCWVQDRRKARKRARERKRKEEGELRERAGEAECALDGQTAEAMRPPNPRSPSATVAPSA